MSGHWAQGRYRSVADHIAPLATQLVSTAATRTALPGAVVYDLGCGIGSAALICAAEGAQVTGVDITPELLEQASADAETAGVAVRWQCADAGSTGLPTASADAVISSVGIIFVDPADQVPEIARLLKPAGTLAYTAWKSSPGQPLRTPIQDVVGPPPAGAISPDSWADPDIVAERLDADFADITIDEHMYTWQFGSLDEAMALVTAESPVHVNLLSSLDDDRKQRVVNGFRGVFEDLAQADGSVAFAVPYVVVTATRR